MAKQIKYAYARPDIQSGDVVAFSHNHWGSWYDLQVMAVRIGQMSEYCHVGMVWCDGGRVYVAHATGAGVIKTPLSELLPCYCIPIGVWTSDTEDYIEKHLGERYSKWQAVKAFFGRLTAGSDAQWQCSEWVTVLLRQLGVLPTDSDTLTPAKTVLALQRLNLPTYYLTKE